MGRTQFGFKACCDLDLQGSDLNVTCPYCTPATYSHIKLALIAFKLSKDPDF